MCPQDVCGLCGQHLHTRAAVKPSQPVNHPFLMPSSQDWIGGAPRVMSQKLIGAGVVQSHKTLAQHKRCSCCGEPMMFLKRGHDDALSSGLVGATASVQILSDAVVVLPLPMPADQWTARRF